MIVPVTEHPPNRVGGHAPWTAHTQGTIRPSTTSQQKRVPSPHPSEIARKYRYPGQKARAATVAATLIRSQKRITADLCGLQSQPFEALSRVGEDFSVGQRATKERERTNHEPAIGGSRRGLVGADA